MLDRTATTWLKRLLIWLELFEQDFSRQSQRGALRRYVSGLLSDSRRKSMEAMWARLSDPGTYQAAHSSHRDHFVQPIVITRSSDRDRSEATRGTSAL